MTGYKIKKKRKGPGQRGHSTHGHGARKKWKKSGHKGGVGMAGTGKRADHKKSLIIKLYGNNYFGKQGITSRSTEHKINDVMNISEIQKNYDSLMKKYGKGEVLEMPRYKILGEGEISRKVKIKARAVSTSAKEKIEKAGGEVILEVREKKKEDNSHKKAVKTDKPTDSKSDGKKPAAKVTPKKKDK